MNIKSLLNQINNEEYIDELLKTINDSVDKRDSCLKALEDSTKNEIFTLTEKYLSSANTPLKNLLCSLCIGAMHDSVSINNDYIYTILFKNIVIKDQFAYYYMCNLIPKKKQNDFLERVNKEVTEKEV